MVTLLERERELSELTTALSDAREGRGRFVLVEAPAGLGKSSLVRAALEDADGFTVLRARANELERNFAFGCVRQLLEPAAARQPDLFEGAAIVAEALFKPFGSDDPDLSFTMLHGLYWMLSNLADRGPVVVAVDDAHWADEESLRFLSYLAPALGRPRGGRLRLHARGRGGDRAAGGRPGAAGPAAGPAEPRGDRGAVRPGRGAGVRRRLLRSHRRQPVLPARAAARGARPARRDGRGRRGAGARDRPGDRRPRGAPARRRTPAGDRARARGGDPRRRRDAWPRPPRWSSSTSRTPPTPPTS